MFVVEIELVIAVVFVAFVFYRIGDFFVLLRFMRTCEPGIV